MTHTKVNIEYLRVYYKEIPLLLTCNFMRRKLRAKKTGLTLIVNPCLIGDFVVSLSAIGTFIKKNPGKVDLMVSPMVKDLAKRIKGVRKVFVVRSVHSRALENSSESIEELDEYDNAIIMRMSTDAFKKIKHIKTKKITTALFPFIKSSTNILNGLLFKKTPKQFWEINFEIFHEKSTPLSFEEIFTFTSKDYRALKNLSIMKTKKEIVLIHTGSSWAMNKWSNEKWISLIQQLHASGNYRFIFIGAKDEKDDYDFIAKKLPFKVYSLINNISLVDLLLLMRLSDYFIGMDSGPRNMAHMVNLRSIVLLGPGPHLYMPNNNRGIVIDKSNGRGLYQRYFYSKHRLTDKITVDEVYDSFTSLTKLKKSCSSK